MLKGEKALSYALKPPKELLRLMNYDENVMVGKEASASIIYDNHIVTFDITHQVNIII